MADTPGEDLLLEAAKTALEGIVSGATYWYTPDAVRVIDIPELKFLQEEHETLLFVHPGDVIYQVDTACKFQVTGDFIVTGARKYQTPELPWETGHVSLPGVRLRLVQDILLALNNKELVPAAGDRTSILAQVADRNLGLEADGWAMAAVSFSFSYSDVLE